MATGKARAGSEDRAGFTLVELMMTVAIIGMAAAAVVMVAPDPRPAVGAEAERFAARLASARDEAVLSNWSIAVETTTAGYGFQAFDGLKWNGLQDGPLKPVLWEAGTTVSAGDQATRVIFDPTGVADPYRVTLRRDNKMRTVTVDGAGEVKVDE